MALPLLIIALPVQPHISATNDLKNTIASYFVLPKPTFPDYTANYQKMVTKVHACGNINICKGNVNFVRNVGATLPLQTQDSVLAVSLAHPLVNLALSSSIRNLVISHSARLLAMIHPFRFPPRTTTGQGLTFFAEMDSAVNIVVGPLSKIFRLSSKSTTSSLGMSGVPAPLITWLPPVAPVIAGKEMSSSQRESWEESLQQLRSRQYQRAQEAARAAEEAQAVQYTPPAPQVVYTAPTSSYKDFIYMHESGNNPGAINPYSGACGLGQALPCSKMPCSLNDYACQDNFFTGYAMERYGSWEAAYYFWLAHSWW